MADKQALNATFFAFRKREKRGVLTMATIAYVAICIVAVGLFTALNFGAVVDYATWYGSIFSEATKAGAGGGALPPEAMMPPASVMALGPMLFLFQILFYVIAAAYEAACLKWLIHGETGGLFGFSFGADTWRVYFTYWIWLFLSIVIGIVLFIVFGAATAGAIGAAGGDAASLGLAALLIPILLLVLCLAWLWIAVRLAPAAATSVARRRFAFFDAWKVTKGRFWSLFGAFFLLWVMYCVAYLLLYAVGGFAIVLGFMNNVGAMGENPSPDQVLAALMQPQVLIPLVLVSIVAIAGSFVWMVAMFGVNARAAAVALEEGRITPG